MKGAIAWMAEHSVAANLLMVFILAAGIFSITTVKQEIFPEFSMDMISIAVPYLGAAPEEVEEGVVVRIEEAIFDIDGIKSITSSAIEGMASVLVELEPRADSRQVLDDIKSRVDAIPTLPAETEKPIITEITNRRSVIDVAVSGDTDERSLKVLAQRVRDDLVEIQGITQVEMVAARPYEISIEVSEEALRRHGLTFDHVAAAIKLSSFDLPGGSIRTDAGEILLRTEGQAYRGDEFEQIVLLSRPDGTRLLLSEVATVIDGFAETDQSAQFNGDPGVLIRVYRVGDQAALDIAGKVKGYIENSETRLPEGIKTTAWADMSRVLRGRLDLMLRSARNGYILVFLILALFLRFRLAFWVSLGIPISFMGALWLMPSLGASINLISLFGFIVVLGIVVDDAIIVGENIFTHQRRSGEHGAAGAARGAMEVAVPVIFGVLTTIFAFMPLLTIPGTMGKFMRVIPTIVIAALVFSLIESLFVLPAHLAHQKKQQTYHGYQALWRRFQKSFAQKLEQFIDKVYRPSLKVGLHYRYAALALAITTFLLTVGVVGGGWVRFIFFPNVESDFVVADLTLPPGTPADITADAIRLLEGKAMELKEHLGTEVGESEANPITHILAAVGDQPLRAVQNQNSGGLGGVVASGHIGEVIVELTPSEERSLPSEEISRRWREMTGPIPDAIELSFNASLFSPGDPINIQLTGPDLEVLREVATLVKMELGQFAGIYDISDSFRPGKQEVKLGVKPAAEAYGITLADLARQVRQAFYGEEAQRIQRGKDDIRVMVRFPADERRSLSDLENLRIRTVAGGEVPFGSVATAELGRGYAAIRRVDRQRAINVTAQVDESVGNAGQTLRELKAGVLGTITRDYPQISYSLEGQQREQQETMSGLIRGFALALIMIYALMAIPFRSYLQPLIIMTAIPFGLVGAIWGHVIMGKELTILSMFGVVALTGVVVNDSIVLVHFINKRRANGTPLIEAVREAGAARFRPIILTSLTTFFGLTPLLLEKSMQAQFLIPMAISLGYGVMFATFITLIIIPVSYVILEDLKRLIGPVNRG